MQCASLQMWPKANQTFKVIFSAACRWCSLLTMKDVCGNSSPNLNNFTRHLTLNDFTTWLFSQHSGYTPISIPATLWWCCSSRSSMDVQGYYQCLWGKLAYCIRPTDVARKQSKTKISLLLYVQLLSGP